MAAPSGTVWGSTVGSYGRIGIYKSLSNTNTESTLTVQIWIWTKYSVSDSNNSFYYDNLAASGSASTSKGSVSVSTTVASGEGWSTSNQKLLTTYTHKYTRGTSAQTRYLYAKLANVDRVGGTMYASTTVSIPKLASYTISYNANGGSGAPSSQTKWYNKSIKLSTTKPTRTGYTFLGWATSSTATTATYAAGASYTANAAVTLYAVWKAIEYTVTFNANGGTGGPTTQRKYHGVTLTLASSKPTRTNYTFKGWSTALKNTTVMYKPGGSYTGNASITLYAVWELAYTKPRITNLVINRCESDGTVSYSGSDISVQFKFTTDLPFTEVCFYYKLGTESEYTLYTKRTNGNTSTITSMDYSMRTSGSIFDANKTYDFKITVSDSNGTTEKTVTIDGIGYTIDLLVGGNGVAFGKPAELEDTADFNFNIHARNGILLPNGVNILALNTDGTIVEALQQSVHNNTIVGYSNYVKQSGNTHIYGKDVVIYTAAAGDKSFRPYYRAGDTINIYMRTAGYVTNAKTNVCFTIPLAKPGIGVSDVTISSIDGLIMRQDGQYTHGSTASVYAKIASYEATLNASGNFIFVTATINDTTNAVNNDATGIYMSVKVTFS